MNTIFRRPSPRTCRYYQALVHPKNGSTGKPGEPSPRGDGSAVEAHPLTIEVGADGVAGGELARQHILGEGVLDQLLDGALQGPCTVHRVVARLAELVEHGVVQLDGEVPIRQALLEQPQLDGGDAANLVAPEGMENHHLVDAVDELGAEMVAHNPHH